MWRGVEGVDEVEELMKVGGRSHVREMTDSYISSYHTHILYCIKNMTEQDGGWGMKRGVKEATGTLQSKMEVGG